MVKIRLRRVGAKHRASYRIVVADSRSPRDGRFIELVGHYNPLTDPATININEEKVLKWLKQGAQPTDTVYSLLRKSGISGIMDKLEPQKVSPHLTSPLKEEEKGESDKETK